jgi:hypothetical protein
MLGRYVSLTTVEAVKVVILESEGLGHPKIMILIGVDGPRSTPDSRRSA